MSNSRQSKHVLSTKKYQPKPFQKRKSFPFSYDSRSTEPSSATSSSSSSSDGRPDLWSEPTAFGDRAHFRVPSSRASSPAVLSVTGVQRFDAGVYICRVDFRQSPTTYHNVTLDVIGEESLSAE